MSLKDLAAEIQRIKAEAQEKGQAILKEDAGKLFAKYPELQAIGWTQYTPYWCDGDTCEFGINEIWGFAGETKNEDGEPVSINDLAFYEVQEQANINGYNNDDYPNTHLVEDVRQFEKSIHDLGDLMKDALGDHCSVLITRDKIVIEEYEHD